LAPPPNFWAGYATDWNDMAFGVNAGKIVFPFLLTLCSVASENKSNCNGYVVDCLSLPLQQPYPKHTDLGIRKTLKHTKLDSLLHPSRCVFFLWFMVRRKRKFLFCLGRNTEKNVGNHWS